MGELEISPMWRLRRDACVYLERGEDIKGVVICNSSESRVQPVPDNWQVLSEVLQRERDPEPNQTKLKLKWGDKKRKKAKAHLKKIHRILFWVAK